MSGVFVFGANSMIGWSLVRAGGLAEATAFGNRRTKPLPPGVSRRINLNDEAAVAELFAREQPWLIVHCAGVCNVESCETSPEFAHSVNVEGARLLAEHAPPDARIVYVSSDHVFGAGGAGPYDESARPTPISVYGRTRVAAEEILLARPNTLVVRTSLWIGPSSTGRIGHLDWLRYRHGRGLPMTVIGDEVRSAVWADDAAPRLAALARSPLTGLRHLTADRAASRPELAAYLCARFDIGARFAIESRHEQRAPHLGDVELSTRYRDELAAPLPSVVPAPVAAAG